MSERLITAVDALEAVICERYNVKSLTGVGPFAEALALARVGDLDAIDAALAGREMYRWRETAQAALAEVHDAAAEAAEPVKAKPKAKKEEAEQESPVEPTT